MTAAFGTVGTTCRTRSGAYVDLIDPDPSHIVLDDIAHALSQLCRFGGHTCRFYSVAEHSWHAAHQARHDGASMDVERACLLHDATEAYLGDVIKPLKVLLPTYQAIESRWQEAIRARFRLSTDPEVWAQVREIDHALLIAERGAFFSADSVQWSGEGDVRRLPRLFYAMDAENAKRRFLSWANLLEMA